MDLPVIDLEPFLKWRAAQKCESELPVSFSGGDAQNGDVAKETGLEFGDEDVLLHESCAAVAACLRETGSLVIHDPCCSTADNDRFLDMMERYFGQSADLKAEAQVGAA